MKKRVLLYLIDSINNYIHVFDVSGLPGSTPRSRISNCSECCPTTSRPAHTIASSMGGCIIVGMADMYLLAIPGMSSIPSQDGDDVTGVG
jgi:hypothetical protein